MAAKPTHLDPSELGTKEYWNNLYTTELANNETNPDDIGTVWFDDSDAEEKMLAFLLRLAGDVDEDDEEEDQDDEPDTGEYSTQDTLRIDKESTSFLDLGCGNGSILISLRKAGFLGNLHGVDYSPQSVSLAKQISASISPPIKFTQWDLLNDSLSDILTNVNVPTWDVVLDKGTFDAISLNAATDASGRRVVEGYRERVLSVLRTGGLFLITSCNWTESELKGWFVDNVTTTTTGTPNLEIVGKVKYRTFSFGGVKGQTISTICFRKL